MKLVILKTDIESRLKLEAIKPVFNNHPVIARWCIDTDDCDNVLKVEATEDLSELDVIDLVKKTGFHAECLPD